MMGEDYTAPQYERSALITIDVQRDFLDGEPFAISGTSAAVTVIGRLVNVFRREARPIIHVVRLYRADGSNVDLCRRQIVERGAGPVLPGSAGSQLAASLLPSPGTTLDADLLLSGQLQTVGPLEWIIHKPRWGAFFGTALEEHLRGLQISTLAFAGCNFPNCPRSSIYEASERDFRIVVIEDAVSGWYDRGRAELEGIGVHPMPAERFLREIESVSTRLLRTS
jgi:nicotinamidase-related amidase